MICERDPGEKGGGDWGCQCVRVLAAYMYMYTIEPEHETGMHTCCGLFSTMTEMVAED